MKKLASCLAVVVAICASPGVTQATGSSSGNGYNTPIYTPTLNFQASVQPGTGKVSTNWEVYAPAGFNYYKVIRSTTNSDPVYPDDGYITAISDSSLTSYTDQKPPTGTVYYRVCSIVSPNRYCSNVVTVQLGGGNATEPSNNNDDTGSDDSSTNNGSDDGEPYPNSEQWRERCQAWNGTIDSSNNCTWSGGLWCDRWALYDGDCLDIFAKYYDPRTNTNDQSDDTNSDNNSNSDDITGNAYSTAIWYLKNRGVVQGYGDGTYRPNNGINRAEFTKIVMEAIWPGMAAGSNCFTDVGTEWFAPYICLAKTKSLVGGFSDGGFHPYQSISMAEAAKIVMEAMEMAPDAGSYNNWYSGYMKTLSDNKYIPQTVTGPFHNITRGEMAELIWRAQEGVDYMPSATYSE